MSTHQPSAAQDSEAQEPLGAAPAPGPEPVSRKRKRVAIALATIPAVALTLGAAFFAGSQTADAGGTSGQSPQPVLTVASAPGASEAVEDDVPAQSAAPISSPSTALVAAPTSGGPTTTGSAATTSRPTATQGAAAVASPSGPSQAQIDRIDQLAGDVVDDITEIDVRMQDGIMVSSRLSMLADDFARLQRTPAPPGVSEADYYGRAAALEQSAREAAAEYDIDPIGGTARYEVLRGETQPLLDDINASLGTSHTLPHR